MTGSPHQTSKSWPTLKKGTSSFAGGWMEFTDKVSSISHDCLSIMEFLYV